MLLQLRELQLSISMQSKSIILERLFSNSIFGLFSSSVLFFLSIYITLLPYLSREPSSVFYGNIDVDLRDSKHIYVNRRLTDIHSSCPPSVRAGVYSPLRGYLSDHVIMVLVIQFVSSS